MTPTSFAAFAVLAFAGLLLSGCSGAGNPGADDPPSDAILVTAPDDYSYVDKPDAMSRPHLHDYWGGREVILVMDTTYQGINPIGTPGGYTLVLNFFQPDGGFVVPQGAANLTASVTLTPGLGDMYQDPVVAWRGPAEGGFGETDWGWVPADDGAIRIPLGPEDADLPHQVLSGWTFTVGLHPTPAGFRFTGTMRLFVEAERGLPIPTFPGHPDQWNGSTQLPLFDAEGEVKDLYLPPYQGCQTLMTAFCPMALRPDDGALVPTDAAYVEVRMQITGPTTGLHLSYHGADTRAMRDVEPTEESDGLRVYRIPVQGDGDGPYAKQSLWEFLVTGTDMAGDRLLEVGNYHLTAVAYRDEPVGPAQLSTLGEA